MLPNKVTQMIESYGVRNKKSEGQMRFLYAFAGFVYKYYPQGIFHLSHPELLVVIDDLVEKKDSFGEQTRFLVYKFIRNIYQEFEEIQITEKLRKSSDFPVSSLSLKTSGLSDFADNYNGTKINDPEIYNSPDAVFHFWMNQFLNYMRAKNYSKRTQRVYSYALGKFFRYFNSPDLIRGLAQSDILRFMNECFVNNGQSTSSMNAQMSALKIFYLKILKIHFELDFFVRPKREKVLPTVLTESEVSRLLQSYFNLKHKCLVSLMYSCGLRVSEVVGLKIGDLDFEERTIHIHAGKGFKDRYVNLDISLENSLKVIIENRNVNDPVFSNPQGRNLSIRSIQEMIKRGCHSAGISKNVSPHTLRHSFATHLLRRGVNIRHIQLLMGHSSITTTSKYLQVSSVQNNEIPSLLSEVK